MLLRVFSSLRMAGDECNFLGLAGRKESLVEDPDHRVVVATSGPM